MESHRPRRRAAERPATSSNDHSADGERRPHRELAAVPRPRQSELVLAALRSAVPCARLHARQMVWEWGMAPLAEAVELVVSELMTNAVRASEALRQTRHDPPIVQLWLSAKDGRVAVQVWDASEEMPHRRDADPASEYGRGLAIVDAFSESCGAYPLEGNAGKVTWAVIASD